MREVHEAVADPALTQRGLVAPRTFPDGTVTPLMALPWAVDGARPPVDLSPPALGQHTEEFLATFAPV